MYRNLFFYIVVHRVVFHSNTFVVLTLAARGLEELFFQLCCRVSFWFWREIGFGLQTYVLIVSYYTVVVLCQFICFWREIVFGTYVLTIQLWCCVSFLVLAGNSLFGVTNVHNVQYSCAVVFLKNDYSVSLF